MKNCLPHLLALALCAAIPALAEDTAPAQPEAQVPATQAPADSAAVDWTARAKEAFLATYKEACAGSEDDKMENRAPEVFDLKYRQTSDEADAPDRSVTLFRFECTRGAYNFGQVYFLRNGFDELQPLAFAEPDIHVDYENEDSEGKVLGIRVIGLKTSNILINSDVDANRAMIASLSKWRGVGDASSIGAWILKGGQFVLSTYDVDASYDGEVNPQMVLDYRAENEKLSETP